MHSNRMFVSLVPWLVFSVIAGRAGAGFVGWAAAAATTVTIAIAVDGLRGHTADGGRSHLKVIDAVGILTFAVLTVLAFAGSHELRRQIVDYGRGACALVLAALLLGSLLVVPVTEQYAREQVPQPYWHSPVFRALNRRVTATFGVAVLTMAVGHLVAGWLESRDDLTTALDLILNWAVPIVALVCAIRFTELIKGSRATS